MPTWFHIGLLLLLAPLELHPAVTVGYRGTAPGVLPPNVIGITPFDVNGDGTDDFFFGMDGFSAGFGSYGTNRFVGYHDPAGFYADQVSPVSAGELISSASTYPFGSLNGSWYNGSEYGNPLNAFLLGYVNSGFMQYANDYIGVEFMAADGLHYGWIKYVGYAVAQIPLLGPNGEILGYTMGISAPGGIVDEWAFETQPNTPIIAGTTPEPSRVILLAFGMIIMLHRRRRVFGVG